MPDDKKPEAMTDTYDWQAIAKATGWRYVKDEGLPMMDSLGEWRDPLRSSADAIAALEATGEDFEINRSIAASDGKRRYEVDVGFRDEDEACVGFGDTFCAAVCRALERLGGKDD